MAFSLFDETREGGPLTARDQFTPPRGVTIEHTQEGSTELWSPAVEGEPIPAECVASNPSLNRLAPEESDWMWRLAALGLLCTIGGALDIARRRTSTSTPS